MSRLLVVPALGAGFYAGFVTCCALIVVMHRGHQRGIDLLRDVLGEDDDDDWFIVVAWDDDDDVLLERCLEAGE